LLLKAAAGAVFGLINGASLADILQAGGGPDGKGPGGDDLASAQSRLGENLIRYLADHAKPGANLIVSPASLASILAFVDLGANSLMRSAIHRTLGFKPAARLRTEHDLAALRNGVAAISARSAGPLMLANLLAFDLSTRPRQLALLGLSGAGADVLVDNLGDAKMIGRINEWVRQKTRDHSVDHRGSAPGHGPRCDQRALFQGPLENAVRSRPDPVRAVPGRVRQAGGCEDDVFAGREIQFPSR